MGTSIVITSGKGGVGKSTTTVGIGRALAARGRRVLLIDCDAGLRSLDRLTGAEKELVYDISDVIHGRCAPIDAIYSCSGSDTMFMIPAGVSSNDIVNPVIMKKFVEMLKNHYDYILLDCPAGLGGGFLSAACGADKAVVICSPDPVCVRGNVAVREKLTEMGKEDISLVINRFSDAFFDTTAIYEDLDSIIDGTGIRLLGVVPEDYLMTANFFKGKPAEEDSKGMMALSRITGRIEGEMIPVVI